MYNNVLYFEHAGTDDPTYVSLWGMNLKTLSIRKKFDNGCVVDHYGRYVLVMPNSGAAMPLPCYVYNLVTKKKTLISRTTLTANITNGKIYYVTASTSSYSDKGYPARAKSCSLSGKTRKNVSKLRNMQYCYKLTANYMIYHTSKGYYKYTFKTGKAVRVTV